MRLPMSLVSVLFLLMLLVESTQAIRLEAESLAVYKKIIHKESPREQQADTRVLCEGDEPCSGRVRKLMTKAIPTSKSEANAEKEIGHHTTEEVKKSKKAKTVQVEKPEIYPDVLDIADYSPARRKPPIHN